MDQPDAPSIDGLANAAAFELLAHQIDLAFDTADLNRVDRALALADELEARSLLPDEQALLDYFRANAWACRYQGRLGDRQAVWDFEQPEVGKEVFYLRRAAYSPGFAAMDKIRRCQILTNLGNQLDTLGRFVDARVAWTEALAIDPNFWMARANRGRGLMFYAGALYDGGHQGVFALQAHRDLVEAIRHISLHPHLGDASLSTFFEKAAAGIADRYDLKAIALAYQPDEGQLGDSENERTYRRWCLANDLFLNPLNDVEAAPIAARDVMTLPSFVTAVSDSPVVIGMFNELKQSYASARYLLWEACQFGEPHFSDRDVLLYDTLDYASHGLRLEKVKAAFRIAYSLLDKIAFFLNHYLSLGIPEKGISFRTLWREKPNGPVRDRFAKSENWPLRGLFWLSKDLFELEMRDSTEPDARALAELRNHIEHKYVKVLEMTISSPGDPFHDPLAHPILRADLERRTLRLMQLVRAALIYLSLGMHREERERAKSAGGLTAPMPLTPLPDAWKR